MKKVIVLIVVLILSIGGFLLFQQYQKIEQKNSILSQKPERLFTKEIQKPVASVINVTTRIYHKELQKALNVVSDKPQEEEGEKIWKSGGKIKKKNPTGIGPKYIEIKVPKVNVGYWYKYTVKRTKKISVRGKDDKLTLTIPVSIKGKAGSKGDLDKYFKVKKRRFKGAVTITATVGVDLDEAWEPILHIDFKHTWDESPKVEIIEGKYLDLSAGIDTYLKYNKEKLKKDIQDIARKECAKLKAELAQHWKEQSFPINIDSTTTIYGHIIPKGTYFSGVKVNKERLKISLGADVLTSVESREGENRVVPLPPLKKRDKKSNKIVLELPINVGYQLIREKVLALVDKKIEKETPAGKITVTINDIELYPSNDNLVVGLDFNALFSKNMLSVKGQVFLMSKPEINDGVLTLKNIRYSRILDNTLWATLSAAFEEEILDEIKGKATYDLNPHITDGEKILVEKLNEFIPKIDGVKLKVAKPQLAVHDIYTKEKDITAVVQMKTAVNVNITSKLSNLTKEK